MKNYFYLTILFLGACAHEKNFESVHIEDSYSDFIKVFSISGEIPDFNQDLPEFLKSVGMETPYIDNRKAQMGRVLFYDKNLSADGKVSCGTCHQSALAFSDNLAFSHGANGKKSLRNSSPLGNVANFAAHYRSIDGKEAPALLWDQRSADIREQIRLAVENPHEMGTDLETMAEKVNSASHYTFLLDKLMDKNSISALEVADCLAEFVGSIGGAKSQLDIVLELAQGELDALDMAGFDTIITIIAVYYNGTGYGLDTTILPFFIPGIPTLNATESLGRRLFVDNCTLCHSPIRPAQSVFAACNGLDLDYTDEGLGAITGDPKDMGVFKSPSLRNIALTAPYMHDGRFETLGAVLDFYSKGIKDHPNLHPLLKNKDGSVGMDFSTSEKQALLAFLNTMTDESFLKEERFENPFK